MHRPPTLHDRIDLEPVRHRHAPTLPIPVMEPRDRAAPRIDRAIGRVIVLSRYILVIFYLGLIVALGIYAVNLLVAAFVSRPNLRRLVGIGRSGDDQAWRRRARQQRYVAYAMAAATGVIGFLMSTQPELW